MGFLDTIAKELIKAVIDTLRDKAKVSPSVLDKIETQIDLHLTEVLNWSRDIQFYGMVVPEDITDKTVQLSFDTIPRRFRGERSSSEKLDESALLEDTRNTLLLGDPGSGKTTTIKRLAQHILTQQPQATQDIWQYPVVIVLKNSPRATSIFELLADVFGLRYEYREVEEESTIGDGLRLIKSKAAFVEDERLDRIVPRILNSTSTLVFLDGLDEVLIEARSLLAQSIVSLALRLTLGTSQIRDIAARWLGDAENFLSHLERLPFTDLATRPLFLCQLMVFYRNTGYLPDEPTEVYRRIISLLLEDWDRSRGVQRRTKYANFNADKKLDFLAALSYHLTYSLHLKTFGRRELSETYKTISQLFDLPVNQALDVAREIETHTGLIVESGLDTFEFSHLSLQEYLCAYYLVREPFAENMIAYFSEYPDPIALAICLSSNPSNWFSALILSKKVFSEASPPAFLNLLTRLEQEKPRFVRSLSLGFASINMIFRFGFRLPEQLAKFMDRRVVKLSIADALRSYHIDLARSNSLALWLDKDSGQPDGCPFIVPDEGPFPKSLFEIVRQEVDIRIVSEEWGKGRSRGKFWTQEFREEE